MDPKGRLAHKSRQIAGEGRAENIVLKFPCNASEVRQMVRHDHGLALEILVQPALQVFDCSVVQNHRGLSLESTCRRAIMDYLEIRNIPVGLV